jgi:1,4-alpha-glucan branching enzyme
MSNQANNLLTQHQIEALISANYQDVFSLLGMHKDASQQDLIIRSFLPGATGVDIIDLQQGKKISTLALLDPAGLFAANLGRRELFPYALRVNYPEGESQIHDPYSFPCLLNAEDLYLFCEGCQEQTHQWMGAHHRVVNNISGCHFVVWAPEAKRVSVVGDFNAWDGRCHVMRKPASAGVWEIFIPGIEAGACYKYEIVASNGQRLALKSDPYAFAMQHPPQTASLVPNQKCYQWQDQAWMDTRENPLNASYDSAVSIYEVHLGSWRRSDRGTEHAQAKPAPHNSYLTYSELAEQLIPYVLELGFSHIQLMPVSEFPFDGSWGYQPVGLFAPTSRFGSAQDFKAFIDACHQQGLGVLLDWVPGHFPCDEHGTGKFDGSCLYEHEDVRKGFHPDWQTLIYNYGRKEVQSYLLSNAMYWLEQYHIDGLRVDAVASMLYLDYSRAEGEWLPNIHGGRENLEAIEILKQVNSRAYFNHPGIAMVAEESTAWPGVSRPVEQGGLGFGFKWNMGWMNDTLSYMQREPEHRQYHHDELTFGLVYAFSENFVLPLSHDEVVHGKGSLLSKMPGDEWQQFANLRAYYTFMWTHPGKKLLFMGGEFGQRNEWDHDISLDWHLLDNNYHQGVQNLIKDLNHLYRDLPALHQLDCDASGFEWLVSDNNQQSVLVYLRKGRAANSRVLVVVNMTANSYSNYSVGLPLAGLYRECLNSNSAHYGGSNLGNEGVVLSQAKPYAGQPHQISIVVAPLATQIFEWQAAD